MRLRSAYRVCGVATVLALGLGLLGCQYVIQEGPEVTAAAGVEPMDLERQILGAVNQEREERGLQTLAWTDDLLVAAREHSQRMEQFAFFSHEDPELGSLPARLRRHRVRALAAGENLFMMKGFRDPAQTAIQGWLNSPGHREAMLSTQFSQSAVGVHEGPDGTIYVTQLFRRPSPVPLPLREVPGRGVAAPPD